MRPLIQYTETRDGVRIAFYAMGRGVPVVVTSLLFAGHLGNTHVFKEHHRSRGAGGLGRGMTVVRYDARGTGLSDRDSIDFSLEAQMRDLAAVCSAAGVDRFALFGRQAGCPLAVVFAARYPERVSHLVLADPIVRGRDVPHMPLMAGMEATPGMTQRQWEVFTLAMANITVGYSSQPFARRVAKEFRDAMSPESYRAYVSWRTEFDVSHLLPTIEVPTLVVSSRREYYQTIAAPIAASVRDARIFTIEADDVIPGRWQPEATAAIEEFIGIAPAAPLDSDATASADATARLTPREREVLKLLVAGRSNREIAEDLTLSERTVARHIANMYEKVGVHGRAEITAYALRHGLA